MKLVLELKNTPKKDDILVFDGKNFECVSKVSLLKALSDEIASIKDELNVIRMDISDLQREVTVLKGEE